MRFTVQKTRELMQTHAFTHTHPSVTPSSVDPEEYALAMLVSEFSEVLLAKVLQSYQIKKRAGWDDPTVSIETFKESILGHLPKGDPRDIAIFAMFWWNRKDSDGNDPPAFVCPACGAKSWNRNDKVHQWCGKCHKSFLHEPSPQRNASNEAEGSST